MQNLVSRFRRRASGDDLSKAAAAVLKEGLTYLSPRKFKRIERALRETARVPGDMIECGVALGGSAIVIAHHASARRRFIGLDVFDMIPEPSSPLDDDLSKQRYEIIRSGRSQGIGGATYYGYRDDLYECVVESFRRHGLVVDGTTIRLKKGLFEETFPTLELGKVAFAHLDCDWYDPVSYCLDQLAPRMSPGGQIVVDDYHAYGGCRVAVDEFLVRRRDFTFQDGENPILQRAPVG